MQEMITEIMVDIDRTAGPTVITIAAAAAASVEINKPGSNRIKKPAITNATAVAAAAATLADSQTITEAVDAEPKSKAKLQNYRLVKIFLNTLLFSVPLTKTMKNKSMIVILPIDAWSNISFVFNNT